MLVELVGVLALVDVAGELVMIVLLLLQLLAC